MLTENVTIINLLKLNCNSAKDEATIMMRVSSKNKMARGRCDWLYIIDLFFILPIITS